MRSAIFAVLCVLSAAAAHDTETFVLVLGGQWHEGDEELRLDDFETSTHPITNAEYEPFVNATAHKAPLHWENGKVPPGVENHPVVFVNRYDVAAYVQWRTDKEKRIYRLPTEAEFFHAQRVGSGKYPWGSEDPEGRTNYDARGFGHLPSGASTCSRWSNIHRTVWGSTIWPATSGRWSTGTWTRRRSVISSVCSCRRILKPDWPEARGRGRRTTCKQEFAGARHRASGTRISAFVCAGAVGVDAFPPAGAPPHGTRRRRQEGVPELAMAPRRCGRHGISCVPDVTERYSGNSRD